MKRLPMNWLNNLKIAIIEQDVDKIGVLCKEMPQLKSKAQLIEAQALIAEAISLTDAKKLDTLKTINKIRQTKAFLV